jgi:hypothetical protein
MQPRSGDEYCAPLCNADGDCRGNDNYHCLPDPALNVKECRTS